MTLVLARIENGLIAMVGDTNLVKSDSKLPIQHGTIKVCPLPGGICVGYCNSPELAVRDINKFIRSTTSQDRVISNTEHRYTDVVNFFAESSKDTGNDYIIAFGRLRKIVKISHGKPIRTIAKTAWIGEKEAYELFRKYEAHDASTYFGGRAITANMFMCEQDGSPASNLFSAFSNVVFDPSTSVGGQATVVGWNGVEFQYSVVSSFLYDWPTNLMGEKIELNTPYFHGSTNENAEYSVSQITTSYSSLNIVGYYYLSGRKLFLQVANGLGVPFNCIVLENVEPSEIEERIVERLGFDPGVRVFVASGWPSKNTTVPLPIQKPGSSEGAMMGFFCHANNLERKVDKPIVIQTSLSDMK